MEVHRFAKLRHDLKFTHHERIQSAANLHELAPSIRPLVELKRYLLRSVEVGDLGTKRLGFNSEAHVKHAVARRKLEHFGTGEITDFSDVLRPVLKGDAFGGELFGGVDGVGREF